MFITHAQNDYWILQKVVFSTECQWHEISNLLDVSILLDKWRLQKSYIFHQKLQKNIFSPRNTSPLLFLLFFILLIDELIEQASIQKCTNQTFLYNSNTNLWASEAVAQTCSVKKVFLDFRKIHRKTSCQILLFNKVAGGAWRNFFAMVRNAWNQEM